ncbi:periplasmic nitrate reductase [Striga asiatica]|uniref:Periplasmic nitrate reductase n=1 Tax=Striga asiatica TaxID=4170 RepID=A0A5A7Q2L0_STRAF|nr:periplasmic nitrate reductase [Striga asiatica]
MQLISSNHLVQRSRLRRCLQLLGHASCNDAKSLPVTHHCAQASPPRPATESVSEPHHEPASLCKDPAAIGLATTRRRYNFRRPTSPPARESSARCPSSP